MTLYPHWEENGTFGTLPLRNPLEATYLLGLLMFQFFDHVATIPETLPYGTGIAHFLNNSLTNYLPRGNATG